MPRPHELPPEARIQWATARQAAAQDDDLLVEITEAFLSECDGLCSDLTRSLLEGNMSEATRAAHTLKCNLRSFGTGVASTMQRIEQSVKSGLMEPMIPVWQDAQPLVVHVAGQLRDWLEVQRGSELS